MARKKLGKYEIIERIGRGGMAEVYRGYHAALDRYVAIKLLHAFLADDPEFKDRFEKEARNVAKLRHPNIVQVYDFEYDEQGDSYYMVMEFINGPTLKERLYELSLKGEQLSRAEAIRIVRDAAKALAYAHQRNMIHRDVKPANLMLDEDGRVVLTDFGIAKMVTGTQFTASGGMVGTPAYMAPEQGLGEAGDERSDIYSLGVILYQLMTGKLPFEADSPLALILKHVNEPLPDPRQLVPDLPEALARIIVKSLEKDPANRYQTAIEFAQDLSALDEHGNMPTPIRAPGMDTPARRQATLPPTKPVVLSTERHHRLNAPANLKTSTPTTPPTPVALPARAEGRLRPLSVLGLALGTAALVLIAFLAFGRENTALGGLFREPSPTPPPITATAVAAIAETPVSSTPNSEPTEIPAREQLSTATATRVRPTTATAPPTLTPTVPATSTPTPSPSATPTPSATPSPDMTGTAAWAFFATQAAATPTPNMTLTLAACDFEYIVAQPEDYNQPPAFSDVGNPRLVPANENFSFDLVLENVGDCDWPEGTRLSYNADLTENPDATVNLERVQEVCEEYTGLNFARQERPNFFLSGPVGVTEQSAPITFTGTAPRVFGCYYSVWDLLYPNSTITIGRPLVLTIRVWGGG